MVNGSKAINQLIEERLEQINLSDEFISFTNTIHQEFEHILDPYINDLETKEKMDLIDSLRAIVFEQVFFQSKITYKTGFKDGLSFTFNEFVIKDNKC